MNLGTFPNIVEFHLECFDVGNFILGVDHFTDCIIDLRIANVKSKYANIIHIPTLVGVQSFKKAISLYKLASIFSREGIQKWKLKI